MQCIYIDPPYGIRFNSNFQWSTTSRDVRDGNRQHITREPEQVKAYRDTWRHGIHSYLTYLLDRLTVARDLLTDSGSIFVQIGDENVHRVRAVMDEVLGESNFVSQIMVKKTGGVGATQLDNVFDFLIWYAKSKQDTKYRELFFEKLIGEGQGTGRRYDQVETQPFAERGLHKSEKENVNRLLEIERDGARFFQLTALVSESSSAATTFDVEYQGVEFSRTNWKTNYSGIARLTKSDRVRRGDRTLRFKRYLTDFPASVVTNYWDDTGVSGKTYVVQTAAKVLEPVYDLLRISAAKARTTICRLVLSSLSQFFQRRRHFSSQPKDRSTTQRFGSTAKVCSSFAFDHFHRGSQQVLHRRSKMTSRCSLRPPALSAPGSGRSGVGRTSPEPRTGQ